ncbi:MAG: single-stranded DNA-binding protein [Faecalibacterium prausnitzii]
MILTHKTGVLLHGTLAKDPVFKDVGQKQVLKFDVKAHSVKTDTGSWESLYVQVNVWHGLDKWDGMLLKGDAVTVFARELKTREYNGKTYYSVDADDIQPGGLVLFQWMQNLIDLLYRTSAIARTDQPFRRADIPRRETDRLRAPNPAGGSSHRSRRRHPGG